MIEYDAGACENLENAKDLEWLETNSLGGYASSTITGLNTRRYHALLMAAVNPPAGRAALLSKLEETLIVDGASFDISVNRYWGDSGSVIHPQGHLLQTGFRLDPWPVFTWRAGNVELEKEICMIDGENTVVVRYRVIERPPDCRDLRLRIRPLVSYRDYHSLTRENASIDGTFSESPGTISIRPYPDLPGLHFSHDAESVSATGYWYRNFEYEAERERGLDFSEDLFNHFQLECDLTARSDAALIVSTAMHLISEAPALLDRERARRVEIADSVPGDGFRRDLTSAARQFIVSRGEQQTVIAGYHWFADWGRDTMIALPGLTAGLPDTARSILLEFSNHVSRGMLPNRFVESGEEPEYNTVDATLWYFEAVRRYLDVTRDENFIRERIYPVLRDIVDHHLSGTRYGIHCDVDGLIQAGVPGVQLTWMDARIGDFVVTPRTGKAVEIQALWYNALKVMERLAAAFGSGSEQYASLAARVKTSFNDIFWNDVTGCLYDVIDGENRDASIRPNQILAVSLKHDILNDRYAKRVFETVRDHLLTPCGLRTLSPTDPKYRGRYGGDIASRDGAYHQGTVWPWLMGPFIDAHFRLFGVSESTRDGARQWLAGIERHLQQAGLGQISEVFDGDAPHRPGGCIAQAWSVAEILRVIADYDLFADR